MNQQHTYYDGGSGLLLRVPRTSEQIQADRNARPYTCPECGHHTANRHNRCVGYAPYTHKPVWPVTR